MVMPPYRLHIHIIYIVVRTDPAASERPTLEWQDRLSESLARWAQSRQPPAPEPNSSTRSRIVHYAASKLESSRDAEEPARTKRKVTAHTSDSHVSWDDVHGTAGTFITGTVRRWDMN